MEKAKAAETILADELAGARVVDIDEHVFVWMAGEETGKQFDETFLSFIVGIHETVADVEFMGALAAIEAGPEARAIGAGLIELGAELAHLGFDFLEADDLRVGKAWQ